MMVMAAAMVTGLSSCNKDDAPGGGDPNAVGTVKVMLGFDEPVKTQATQSISKPTTSWADNVHDVYMFFVQGNQIKAVREIPNVAGLTGSTANPNNKVATIAGVPVGTYDAYMVANLKAAEVGKLFQASDDAAWTPESSVGRDFDDLFIEAALHGDYEAEKHTLNTEANSKGYTIAPEIFVAHQAGIVVDDDVTHDYTADDENKVFQLTRIVSLVRVRIDQGTGMNAPTEISFTGVSAAESYKKPSLRIRRATTGINMLKTPDFALSGSMTKENLVYFDNTAYEDTDPTTGYTTGGILMNEFDAWKDALTFPGGHATQSGDKLDIVVTGQTLKANSYVAVGGVTVDKVGEMIAWAGAITGISEANGILEINVTLTNAGWWVDPTDPDKPLPEPGVYGNIVVEGQLMDWGSITSVDVEF